MTTMQIDRAVVEQALEVINDTAYGAPVFRQEVRDTITTLRAALAQPDPQDPELSAALGWPGGISDPVLDRKTLLQMVAALRLASQQALEALEADCCGGCDAEYNPCRQRRLAESLRAALAQQAEPNPMSPEQRQRWEELAAMPQQAEPAQEPVAWNWMLDGLPYGRACYGDPPDADIAERAAAAGRTVRLLYTAPPQRRPLTEEVAALTAQRDALLEALKELVAVGDNVKAGPQTWLARARAAIKAVEEAK